LVGEDPCENKEGAMASEIVTNLVFLRAQAGKAGELEAALRELAQEARNETGSLVYEVHQSTSDSDEYLIYGIWRSKADLDAHMETGAIQVFLGKVPTLVNGGFNLRLFTPVDVVRT
jgi:quinol monooxygenase YgiN